MDLMYQGESADQCYQSSRGHHSNRGERQIQEVPGGREEEIQSRAAEVSETLSFSCNCKSLSLSRFTMKHSKQLEEAKANSAAAIKELEHLQNEKRKMLMEHETAKLKELDESYSKEFTEWKNNLKPRKQVGRINF